MAAYESGPRDGHCNALFGLLVSVAAKLNTQLDQMNFGVTQLEERNSLDSLNR